MPVNRIAENVFGTMGAICWTVQLIPQIWKSWREKSTEGLSPWFVLIWAIGAAPLGVYVIVQNLNIPLILQPQLFGALSLVSWGQCQYYGNRRSLPKSITLVALTASVLGGFEAGMVFVAKPSFDAGDQLPAKVIGLLSSILLALALFPQYHEIYKHRRVIGISIPFMAVDLLGGVFSDLSLVFKQHFDAVASTTYSLVVIMDGVVIIAALVLNPRFQRRQMPVIDSTSAEATNSSRSSPPNIAASKASNGLQHHPLNDRDRVNS